MHTDPESVIERCHARLPGIVRAALVDYGISASVIDKRQIGWDGSAIVIPVRDQRGRFAFFETWSDTFGIGRPIAEPRATELFPWQVLGDAPSRLILAEGIHEALVFESRGLPAVAATGSGLFFKTREWAPLLAKIPEVIVAYRAGERRSRRAFQPSRSELRTTVESSLPNARFIEWPDAFGENGGAFEYFVKLKQSAADFELLTRHP